MRRSAAVAGRVASIAGCVLACLCMSALAQTISEEQSSASWLGLAADGAAVVCPAGDGPSRIEVHVRNASGEGVEGARVYYYLRQHGPASHHIWQCYQTTLTTLTDGNGNALLYPAVGLAPFEPAATACETLGIDVYARFAEEPQVQMLFGGSPDTDERKWRSFDLDANGVVNGTVGGWGDVGIFSGDWLTSACRSDFNGDGLVSLPDNALFTPHASHPALVVRPGAFAGFGDVDEGTVHCLPETLENWGNVSVDWQLEESCDWLTLSSTSGTIPSPAQEPPDPGARQIVDFCINTTGLEPGYYSYGVQLTSNSPYVGCGAPDHFTVWMTVLPPSGIDGPEQMTLEQNHPNPFTAGTNISFTLEHPGRVDLSIYDIRGRLVRRLLAGPMDARRQDLRWDGRDESGKAVVSGVYYYRLDIDGATQARRMVLLR
jgi:hypothetical protein